MFLCTGLRGHASPCLLPGWLRVFSLNGQSWLDNGRGRKIKGNAPSLPYGYLIWYVHGPKWPRANNCEYARVPEDDCARSLCLEATGKVLTDFLLVGGRRRCSLLLLLCFD